MFGYCYTDSQCEYYYQCIDNVCLHKDILPLSFIEILGYFLVIIIIGVSTVGGLGGGIEKVPVIMCLLNYDQKTATHFTYCLMFGANLINFGLLIPQRHPDHDKPVIDYDLGLILLPTVLFGSAIGSMLNSMLPDLALLILTIILMSLLIPGLIKKGQRQKKIDMKKSYVRSMVESQNKSFNETGHDPIDNLVSSLLQYDEDEVYKNLDDRLKKEFRKFSRIDKLLVPYTQFTGIFLLFLIIEFTIIMRGGRDTDSFIGIEFCSTWYWITTALIVVLLFLFGYLIKMYVTYIQQKKMNCHYFRENVDKIYTWLYYFKMWIAGMAGGLMGGMTGVGSGSLMVPTMIIFEVEPRVASATSGFSKLFISAATVILVYIGMEKINKQIKCRRRVNNKIYSILCLSGSGWEWIPIYIFIFSRKQIQVNKLTNQYHRLQYIIIYIVAAFLMVNVLSVVIFIGKEWLYFDNLSELCEFNAYC